MIVRWTDAARADLDAILTELSAVSPGSVTAFEARVAAILDRLAAFPESAQSVDRRPDVRAVPLIRFPHVLFYRLRNEAIGIVHLRHGKRDRDFVRE